MPTLRPVRRRAASSASATWFPNRADVDALLARAEAAGATLTDRPHDRPWGIYSGYFRDLDGHLWEVIWNPRLTRPEA